ncbi:MAG: efflux RND transporter permease subunit [Lachnospiraceae bacterium]|nr:efflux RND transporter permease subunit [Lachnospiraceae bacterium]
MNDFIKTVLARPVGAVVCVLALIIFGVSTLVSMDLEREPSVSYPYYFVTAEYPGAGPEEIERLVTTKLENACSSVKGFKDLYSSSEAEFCYVTVEYEYGTDLKEARDELQNAINGVKAELPKDVVPEISGVSNNDEAVFQACFQSDNEDTDVKSFVKQQIEPKLKKLDGVAGVDVSGGKDRYISIELMPDVAAQYGLDVGSVADLIASSGFITPAGSINYGDQSINVSTSVTVSDIEDIRNTPIKLDSGEVIHIYDIASVRYKDSPVQWFYRFNGKEGIDLSVKKKQKANVVNLGKEIRSVIEEAQRENPDVSVKIIQDNSIPISRAIRNIFFTLMLGVILSMIVLFVFFGDLKASLIVGSSMPISLLVTFILMGKKGYTLNLVTMSALVIGIGMMVDNAIVVLEMCFCKKDDGIDFREAAYEGTKFVFTDIIASTLTSVVVYLPLVNLKGMAGLQFGPLGWTIMFALMASLASALTIVPLAFSRYRPVEKKELPINRLLKKLGNIYEKFMPHILKHRYISAGISAALMIGAVLLFRFFIFDVSSYSQDYDMVDVNFTFKPGYSVENIDEVVSHFEEYVSADPNIDYYYSWGYSGMGCIIAMLPERSRVSPEELGMKWKSDLENYDNRCEVSIGYDFGEGGPTVDIPLSADNYDELKDALAKVEELAVNTEGVTGVKNAMSSGGFKADVVVDREMAMKRGFSARDISDMISSQLQGKKAVDVIVDDRTFEARVELPEDMRADLSSVETMSFRNPEGAYIPFDEIAHIEYRNVPSVIERTNGRYSGTVKATTAVGDIHRIQQELVNGVNKMNLPKGVKLEDTNAEMETREAVGETTVAIAAAVFLVFMVMAIQFESLRYSILVMVCLPFSLIGAMPLLYAGLDEKVINLSTMVGLLMLGGIVVNDGIMYVDTTNEYRKTMPVHDALILAGKSRMRPILMTTLTTVLSMLPMIIPGAGGDPSMRGLAYVVIGGLTMATILTLIILPVFYLFLCKKDPGDNKNSAIRKMKDKVRSILKGPKKPKKETGPVVAK